MKLFAPSLFTLLLAQGASAATTFVPVLGAPVQITVGQTVDFELRLETSVLVGAVNTIFQDSAGLTINSCTAITTGAPDMLCNALGGGKFQGIGSDFGGTGILDLDVVLSINVTGNTVGGAVTLLTQAGDNSNFTLCPTSLLECLIIPNGVQTAYDNEGAILVEVVPDLVIPALSQRGLILLGMLLLTTMFVMTRRRETRPS